MGKSCLVTGGAGFIGSHVCEALLKAGYDVLSVDNFNDFYDPAFKRENIRDIRKTAQAQYAVFESAQCDIRDADALARLFQEYSPAIVLHLAACAGVRPSIAEPLLYASVNITGTINVLECVKKLGIKVLYLLLPLPYTETMKKHLFPKPILLTIRFLRMQQPKKRESCFAIPTAICTISKRRAYDFLPYTDPDRGRTLRFICLPG
jgi:NAD(P)-dependent dehydrogenase (short-subunit alcohol dehydrogenase family)